MAHFYEKVTLVLKSETAGRMKPTDWIHDIFSESAEKYDVSLLEIESVEQFEDPFKTQGKDSRSVGERLLGIGEKND